MSVRRRRRRLLLFVLIMLADMVLLVQSSFSSTFPPTNLSYDQQHYQFMLQQRCWHQPDSLLPPSKFLSRCWHHHHATTARTTRTRTTATFHHPLLFSLTSRSLVWWLPSFLRRVSCTRTCGVRHPRLQRRRRRRLANISSSPRKTQHQSKEPVPSLVGRISQHAFGVATAVATTTSTHNEWECELDKTNNHKQQDLPKRKSSFLDWKWVRQQITIWCQLSLPYYRESKQGRLLLCGLLLLTILNSAVSVLFSFLSKDLWNVLAARDVAAFSQVLQKFLIALILGAPIVAYYQYQRQQLAIHWRDWMTTRTVELYTHNRIYYQLEEQNRSGGGGVVVNNKNDDDDNTNVIIDNPDQRMTQDINNFTGFSLELTVTVLTSLIDFMAFSVILYNIYPQLLLAVMVYASVGTIVTTYLGQSLVPLNLGQLQREGDLRYLLIRWRDNAESIAFYQGEPLEGKAVQDQVAAVVSNRRAMNKQQRDLDFFVQTYRYLVQIVPLAVVSQLTK